MAKDFVQPFFDKKEIPRQVVLDFFELLEENDRNFTAFALLCSQCVYELKPEVRARIETNVFYLATHPKNPLSFLAISQFFKFKIGLPVQAIIRKQPTPENFLMNLVLLRGGVEEARDALIGIVTHFDKSILRNERKRFMAIDCINEISIIDSPIGIAFKLFELKYYELSRALLYKIVNNPIGLDPDYITRAKIYLEYYEP